MRRIRLVETTNIDSHIMWMVPEPVESDHPIYLFVKLDYTDYWNSDIPAKYYLTIYAVGPKWLSPKKIKDAAECGSFTVEEFKEFPIEAQCEILIDYGTAATLWQAAGNNKRKLLKAAREQLLPMPMLIGFYMDRYQNRIGDTGWDWIRGNVGAGIKRYLKRYQKEQEQAAI